jgi:kynurenine formamidase
MIDQPDLWDGETVVGYMDALSNWGRWGADDRLGTLNLITPQKRVEAAGLIRDGETISLSRNLDPSNPDPLGTGLSVLQRFMGLDEVEAHVGEKLRFEAVTEYVGIAAHGSNTHIDGLSHYAWDGKTYNGFDYTDVKSLQGSTKLSVHDAKEGMVTRGVLLDVAAAKGVRWLEPGYAITTEDLLQAENRQKIEVKPGDALLVHTGHVARSIELGPAPGQKQAGLHASTLPFLRERNIAVLGSDAIQDVIPSGFESFDMHRPIHTVGLVAMGLWLIDNVELTELAATCELKKRYEFFFAALPWRMVGVTSAANNPVAIF